MVGRWVLVGAAALAGIGALWMWRPTPDPQPVAAPPGRAAAVPPVPPHPLFSRRYTDSLQGILSLEPADIEKLEEQLRRNPSDAYARLRVMAYDLRADRASRPESQARRARFMLWLVEHQPESEVLGSPFALFMPGQIAAADYERAAKLWMETTAASKSARVHWNAAKFFQHHDPDLYGRHVRAALDLEPGNAHYGHDVGWLLARRVMEARERGHFELAVRELDRVRSASAYEAAAQIFQGEYNGSLALGRENTKFRDMAQRYARMAQQLDGQPRALSQLPPEAAGGLTRGGPVAEPAPARIRYLDVREFPQLPASVADVLRKRQCMMPQPQMQSKVNVIRGEFFQKGESGWAVLCSTRGASTILVFRSDSDTAPEEIARGEDLSYVQHSGGGQWLYSRQINTTGRQYIIEHYRAYGGPEPPPITHDAINDAFLEKASTVYYRHQGKWIPLQGAD